MERSWKCKSIRKEVILRVKFNRKYKNKILSYKLTFFEEIEFEGILRKLSLSYSFDFTRRLPVSDYRNLRI